MKQLILGAAIGAIITTSIIKVLFSVNNQHEVMPVEVENKPLYWVAPMDANYKRDEPGLSPMGMDLVPVYKDGASSIDEGPGTVRISAAVVNNLGVRTTEATYQKLLNKISTVGYVAYDEDKLVHIHPRVDGWIEKLYVKSIGEPVKKGQPLYDLYSPALVNAQEEFLLALERKNKRLINAAENRLVALQLPKHAIDKMKKERIVSQAVTFYAPQDGVIENLYIREGFFVKPGTMLLSIGDLSEVWVEAEVFERQAGQVKNASKVTMTLDYLPGKEWQGQVDYVYPTLDEKTRTVKVRLRFSNKSGEFKPNMFAQVTIYTTGDDNALLIPKEALIRTGSQDRVVLALGDGHFKSVAVNVGRFDNEFVEILSGLSEGEQVVSSAQFLLDSESSKTSDFLRMSQSNSMSMMEMDGDDESASIPSATVTGTINSMMLDHGMLNISRGPIEKWNRAAATLDFLADNTLDISELTVGMEIEFIFEIIDGEFIITAFTVLENESLIDHSNH